MPDHKRDFWDKADIVLKPVGGVVAGLAVAALGIIGSDYLQSSQAREMSTRVYAELMGKREEAETVLRKDMFRSIVETFLKPGSAGLEEQVLNLELLSYNFHESFELAPLFRHVYRQIDLRKPEGKAYLKRLEKVAKEISSRELSVLREGGAEIPKTVEFDQLVAHPEGVAWEVGTMAMSGTDGQSASDPERQPRRFTLELLDVDRPRKEFRVILKVSAPGKTQPSEKPEVEAEFRVGLFAFPMVDNTRLSHAQRCAVVVTDWQDASAEIRLVFFSGDRSSIRDKLFYDEVIHQVLRQQERVRARRH